MFHHFNQSAWLCVAAPRLRRAAGVRVWRVLLMLYQCGGEAHRRRGVCAHVVALSRCCAMRGSPMPALLLCACGGAVAGAVRVTAVVYGRGWDWGCDAPRQCQCRESPSLLFGVVATRWPRVCCCDSSVSSHSRRAAVLLWVCGVGGLWPRLHAHSLGNHVTVRHAHPSRAHPAANSQRPAAKHGLRSRPRLQRCTPALAPPQQSARAPPSCLLRACAGHTTCRQPAPLRSQGRPRPLPRAARTVHTLLVWGSS
jgi:hypothetical protein